jgi:hypothetical protein
MELKELRGRVNSSEYGNKVWIQETKWVSAESNSAQYKFLLCLVSVTREELFKVTVVLCFDNTSLPLPGL